MSYVEIDGQYFEAVSVDHVRISSRPVEQWEQCATCKISMRCMCQKNLTQFGNCQLSNGKQNHHLNNAGKYIIYCYKIFRGLIHYAGGSGLEVSYISIQYNTAGFITHLSVSVLDRGPFVRVLALSIDRRLTILISLLVCPSFLVHFFHFLIIYTNMNRNRKKQTMIFNQSAGPI